MVKKHRITGKQLLDLLADVPSDAYPVDITDGEAPDNLTYYDGDPIEDTDIFDVWGPLGTEPLGTYVDTDWTVDRVYAGQDARAYRDIERFVDAVFIDVQNAWIVDFGTLPPRLAGVIAGLKMSFLPWALERDVSMVGDAFSVRWRDKHPLLSDAELVAAERAFVEGAEVSFRGVKLLRTFAREISQKGGDK